MTRAKILDDIEAERRRQITKWSGKFDDAAYSPEDWYSMIADYNAWARRMGAMGSPEKQRRRLIQVAALAVAAVEVIDAKSAEPLIPFCTVCVDDYLNCVHAKTAPNPLVARCTRPGGPPAREEKQARPTCPGATCHEYSMSYGGCMGGHGEPGENCYRAGGPLLQLKKGE